MDDLQPKNKTSSKLLVDRKLGIRSRGKDQRASGRACVLNRSRELDLEAECAVRASAVLVSEVSWSELQRLSLESA